MIETITAEQYRATKPAKRSKYGNKPMVVDGVRFHSKKEAKRWQQLKLDQLGGKISGLERQVPFRLVVEGQLICKLVIDFRYFKESPFGSRTVCEDSKGYQTADSRIKMKLAAALFPGIEWRLS